MEGQAVWIQVTIGTKFWCTGIIFWDINACATLVIGITRHTLSGQQNADVRDPGKELRGNDDLLQQERS